MGLADNPLETATGFCPPEIIELVTSKSFALCTSPLVTPPTMLIPSEFGKEVRTRQGFRQ